MVVKKVHFLYHAFPLKIFYIHRHKGNFPLLIRPTLYVHSNLCRNRKWLVQMHFWEWKSIITVNRLVIRGRTWGKITFCVFFLFAFVKIYHAMGVCVFAFNDLFPKRWNELNNLDMLKIWLFYNQIFLLSPCHLYFLLKKIWWMLKLKKVKKNWKQKSNPDTTTF